MTTVYLSDRPDERHQQEECVRFSPDGAVAVLSVIELDSELAVQWHVQLGHESPELWRSSCTSLGLPALAID